MIKHIKYFASSLLALLLVGCEFMDIEPDTTLTDKSFYKSSKDMLSALYATYSSLTDNGLYKESVYLMCDVRSDEAFPNQTNYYANIFRHEIENFNITSTNKATQNYWAHHFRGIVRANIVIEKGAELFPDDEDVFRYMQEAKVLRALYYFNLVRAFGPVPIVMDLPEEYEEARNHLRQPVNKVYAQMITDLTEAISSNGLSPKDNIAKGRVTLHAAMALLGKVYLSMPDEITHAAYPNVRAWDDITQDELIVSLYPEGCSNKWEAAKYYLDEVVTRGGYSLVPVFADLFKPENKHNSESLWEVEYASNQTGILGSPYYTAFSPQNYAPRASANSNGYIPAALANKGQGNCAPTGYFMDFSKTWDSMWPDFEYEVRLFDGLVYSDRRISNGEIDAEDPSAPVPVNPNKDYALSIEYPYDPYTATTWRPTVLGFGDDNQYMCGKYMSASTAENNDSDDNWYILRYADVLLMLAEAESHINGGVLSQTQLDATINLVRTRAGIIPYQAAGDSDQPWVIDTPEKVAQAIADERYLELSFEGHRWFDLVRTGKAIEVMNAHFTDYYNAFTSNSSPSKDNYYMKNIKVMIDEYCTLFPIPSDERNANPGLTPNDRAR